MVIQQDSVIESEVIFNPLFTRQNIPENNGEEHEPDEDEDYVVDEQDEYYGRMDLGEIEQTEATSNESVEQEKIISDNWEQIQSSPPLVSNNNSSKRKYSETPPNTPTIDEDMTPPKKVRFDFEQQHFLQSKCDQNLKQIKFDQMKLKLTQMVGRKKLERFILRNMSSSDKREIENNRTYVTEYIDKLDGDDIEQAIKILQVYDIYAGSESGNFFNNKHFILKRVLKMVTNIIQEFHLIDSEDNETFRYLDYLVKCFNGDEENGEYLAFMKLSQLRMEEVDEILRKSATLQTLPSTKEIIFGISIRLIFDILQSKLGIIKGSIEKLTNKFHKK